MRRHRLLARSDFGNAPLESIFVMLFVMFLALGVVQAALVLYARNVVISSAHEGARAAVELGRDRMDAVHVARETIGRSAGGLVNDLSVDVAVEGGEVDPLLRVRVNADIRALGPLPVEFPVETTASASLEQTP